MTQADISDAVKAGDGKRLLRLGTEDPIQTLAFLDGCMRGLIYGPGEPAWIAALESIDVILRRWLGSRDAKQRVNVTERDVDVAILRGAYSRGDLFLVAGAGISKGAGISEWKELVLRVLRSILDLGSPEQRQRVAENIRRSFSFAPISAEEEVKKALADLTPPAAALRQAAEDALRNLTARKEYTSADLLVATETAKKALGDRYFDHLQGLLYFGHQIELSEAHRAIARMVHPKQHQFSTRVFSILTYNFDDLIEKAIWNWEYGCVAHCSSGGKWIHRKHYDAAHPPAVDVYHVHGYVPSQMRCPPGIDLVFSAEEYAVAYGENNSITRLVQTSHLGNALGLIVGSSLRDEYATRQFREVHAKRPGWYNYVLMNLPDDRSKEYYRELGLRVMWFEPSADFREIPGLLNRIAGAAA